MVCNKQNTRLEVSTVPKIFSCEIPRPFREKGWNHQPYFELAANVNGWSEEGKASSLVLSEGASITTASTTAVLKSRHNDYDIIRWSGDTKHRTRPCKNAARILKDS